MTRPEMQATIRDARSSVLAAWNRTTEAEVKTLTDDAYKKLSTVLRVWDADTPG